MRDQKTTPRAPKPNAPPKTDEARKHRDALLDESLEETFPASDPISPAETHDTDHPALRV